MVAAVRVNDLGKAFRQVVALEDISLDVPVGSSFFLLGPNGSGKTTLIRILAGILRPSHGEVRVLEVDPYRHPEELARDVGIAYEKHALPAWASARDYLQFAARSRGLDESSVAEAAQIFEITEYWSRDMGTYSAGMQKRVTLAQAWLENPELLILDEPFSNLDPPGRMLLSELLKARGANGSTTLTATHLAETRTPSTHLAFIVDGVIEAIGPIGELADRYTARSVVLAISKPAEGVRLLLDKGIVSVTAGSDRLVVHGDSSVIDAAINVLESEGHSGMPLEESYDIWGIYRSILSGRPVGSSEEGSPANPTLG